MSNTRHSQNPEEFNQEKYLSSTALVRGLSANVVVVRCQSLKKASDIELVWALQYFSHQDGGLEKLTQNLWDVFPARQGTQAMRSLPETTHYQAEQVKAVRDHIIFGLDEFPLHGELPQNPCDILFTAAQPEWNAQESHAEFTERKARHLRQKQDEAKWRLASSRSFPNSYPVEIFRARCLEKFLKTVPNLLREFCVDPAKTETYLQVSYFDHLYAALHDYLASQDEECVELLFDYAETSLKGLRGIESALKVARHHAGKDRALTLADIQYAIGKSLLPSDNALKEAVSQSVATAKKGRGKALAHPLPVPLHATNKPPSLTAPEQNSPAVLNPTGREQSPASAPRTNSLSLTETETQAPQPKGRNVWIDSVKSGTQQKRPASPDNYTSKIRKLISEGILESLFFTEKSDKVLCFSPNFSGLTLIPLPVDN